MGSASLSRFMSLLNTPFIFVMKKSLYLKKISGASVTAVAIHNTSFDGFLPLVFSMSKPNR